MTKYLNNTSAVYTRDFVPRQERRQRTGSVGVVVQKGFRRCAHGVDAISLDYSKKKKKRKAGLEAFTALHVRVCKVKYVIYFQKTFIK